MKACTYYTDSGTREQPLFVLKDNGNGTVEIGTKDGALVIGKCPVSDVPKVGHCVIAAESKTETKTKTK